AGCGWLRGVQLAAPLRRGVCRPSRRKRRNLRRSRRRNDGACRAYGLGESGMLTSVPVEINLAELNDPLEVLVSGWRRVIPSARELHFLKHGSEQGKPVDI